MHQLTRLLPALFWGIFILVASIMSGKNVPSVKIPHFDKVVHFTLYYVLSALIAFGLLRKNTESLSYKKLFYSFIIAILYGIFIEYLQSITKTGRSAELGDIVANTTGSCISMLLFNRTKQIILG